MDSVFSEDFDLSKVIYMKCGLLLVRAIIYMQSIGYIFM